MITLCVASGFATNAFATVVRLDKELYVVNGPGDQIDIQIIVEGNSQADSPVRGGLFSFGTKLTFDASKADGTDASVVSALDYFGFDASAPIDIVPGSVGMEGNIDQFAAPLASYPGNLLATLTLTNKATAVDSYPLTLDFLRDLAPTEQQFINGDGLILDPTIEFRGARVLVVPEATTFALAVSTFPLCCLVIRSRFRCRRKVPSS